MELTPRGTGESDLMIAAVKSWIAARLGAEGADGANDPQRLDQAFENLARTVFATDLTPQHPDVAATRS